MWARGGGRWGVRSVLVFLSDRPLGVEDEQDPRRRIQGGFESQAGGPGEPSVRYVPGI